jgi:hypothetical protein
MFNFNQLRQKPGFKYFSIAFSIFLIFLIVGIACLVSMYRLTDRVYKPIETANQEKESFFMSDSVHDNIGVNKIAFLKMQYAMPKTTIKKLAVFIMPTTTLLPFYLPWPPSWLPYF